jgi:RecA-family ATPase
MYPTSNVNDWRSRFEETLNKPVDGQRHDWWIKRAFALVGLSKDFPQITDQVIFDGLRSRITDSDKRDSELWRAIRSARKKDPAPPHQRTGGNYPRPATPPKVKPYEPTAERHDLPMELANTTTAEFLERVFRQDEYVCVTRKDKHGALTLDEYYLRDELCDEANRQEFGDPEGVYYCINPAGENSRKDSDVQDYRHLLIELEVPKPERPQYEGDNNRDKLTAKMQEFYTALIESQLPLAAIYTSGGPSIHGLVKVNAESAEEWKSRMAVIYDYCATMPGFDKSNKNLSRLSRLPGAFRGDYKQTLLSWDAGAASFEAWQATLSIDDGLPEFVDTDNYILGEMVKPTELIEGLLHRGSKMSLSGSSKSRKTWLPTDLAIALATGDEWLGFKIPKACKVLYVNLELQEYFFAERRQRLLTERNLTGCGGNLVAHHLRGYCDRAEAIVAKLIERVKTGDFSAIIIDPIYKLYGEREENAAGAMGAILNEFEKLAVQANAAVVYAAHFSKGNQAAKDPIDRTSGSGVFGRDADSIVTATAHETDDALVMEFVLRNFPAQKEFTVALPTLTDSLGVEHLGFVFERRDDLDPAKLKVKPGAKQTYTDDDFIRAVIGHEGGLSARGVAGIVGCSKDTAQTRLMALKKAGKMIVINDKWHSGELALDDESDCGD